MTTATATTTTTTTTTTATATTNYYHDDDDYCCFCNYYCDWSLLQRDDDDKPHQALWMACHLIPHRLGPVALLLHPTQAPPASLSPSARSRFAESCSQSRSASRPAALTWADSKAHKGMSRMCQCIQDTAIKMLLPLNSAVVEPFCPNRTLSPNPELRATEPRIPTS